MSVSFKVDVLDDLEIDQEVDLVTLHVVTDMLAYKDDHGNHQLNAGEVPNNSSGAVEMNFDWLDNFEHGLNNRV